MDEFSTGKVWCLISLHFLSSFHHPFDDANPTWTQFCHHLPPNLMRPQGDCIVLRDRKLNIAPAIKKQVSPFALELFELVNNFFSPVFSTLSFVQTICATNGAVYYAATPPTPTINNIPIEQFATVYPPGVPTIYPPTMPYQPFYQYYSVPMVSARNMGRSFGLTVSRWTTWTLQLWNNVMNDFQIFFASAFYRLLFKVPNQKI